MQFVRLWAVGSLLLEVSEFTKIFVIADERE